MPLNSESDRVHNTYIYTYPRCTVHKQNSCMTWAHWCYSRKTDNCFYIPATHYISSVTLCLPQAKPQCIVKGLDTFAPSTTFLLLCYSQLLSTSFSFLQVPRKSNLAEQLSGTYDCYLEIIQMLDSCMQNALGRSVDWNTGHVCIPCLYKLSDEPALKFSMLTVMDGNNSLKLVDNTFLVRFISHEWSCLYVIKVADAQRSKSIQGQSLSGYLTSEG